MRQGKDRTGKSIWKTVSVLIARVWEPCGDMERNTAANGAGSLSQGMSWGKANTQLNTVSLKKEARQGERLSGLFRGQVAGKSQGATPKKQPHERRREEGEAGTDKGCAADAHTGKGKATKSHQ